MLLGPFVPLSTLELVAIVLASACAVASVVVPPIRQEMLGAREQIRRIKDVEGRIIWPKKPTPMKQNDWNKNTELVLTLCGLGKVVSWASGGSDGNHTDSNIPASYDIEGMLVSFQPHWNHYEVGEIDLELPEGTYEILKSIRAIASLKILPKQVFLLQTPRDRA